MRFSHGVSNLPQLMKISVFGLGYVGAVTAGCLTHQGQQVVGVDVSAQKVETVNRGESPMVEPGLENLLKRARQRGLLRATTDSAEAVATTDASLVCVGTPSTVSGAVDLRFVRQVTGQIADALRAGTKSHVLIFRSTMLPGSTQRLVAELLAEPAAANRLTVFYYPEFLREGTAVKDFLEPSLAVVGTRDGQRPATGLLELFGAGASVMNWPTAEMVKYACNTFHAAKIAFANEIGRLSKQLGIDSATVMSALCADTKLNISACYLRPGNPFGGSCLPKDVRALHHFTRQQGVPLPRILFTTYTNALIRYSEQLLEQLVGSDIAHAVPLTLAAGLGHWWIGSVDTGLLGSLLSGSIPGVILGSWLAARVPEAVLRPILAATLTVVGVRIAM